jgi:hypothetical protein
MAALLLRTAHWIHQGNAPLIEQPLFVLTMVLTSGAALAVFAYAAWGRVERRVLWVIILASVLSLVQSTLILSPDDASSGIWAMALVGMVLLWERPAWRALLLGAALALYSPALLLLPILLIRLHMNEATERSVLLRFLLSTGLVWGGLTLSIMVVDVQGWLAHVRGTSGMIEGFSAFGLAMTAQHGFLPLSADSMRLFAALVYGLLLLLLARHFRTFERAAWMFPAFILWLLPNIPAWSLGLWLLPTFAALLRPLPAPNALPSYSARRTPAYALGIASVLVAGIIVMANLSPRRFEATVRYPLGLDATGQIVEIPLELVNTSEQTLTPTFTLRQWGSSTPTVWHSDDDDMLPLASGERAVYRLRSDGGGFFTLAEGRIEDGAGGASARFTVGPYLEYGFPDALYNPSYDLWSLEQGTPAGWSLMAQPAFVAHATPDEVAGKRAVRLHLDALTNALNVASLEVAMIFPYEPLGFWFYFDPPAGIDPATQLYGVEFVNGGQRALLLYGAQDAPPLISPTLYVARTAVEARTWVYQEIDLRAIYAEAGWSLPELEPRVFRDLEADLTPLSLRLTLGVTGSVGEMSGVFGPIVQRSRYIDPAQLMREAFADPAGYYARLGNTHLRERNYHYAAQMYATALEYTPGDADLLRAEEAARTLATTRLPWEMGQ